MDELGEFVGNSGLFTASIFTIGLAVRLIYKQFWPLHLREQIVYYTFWRRIVFSAYNTFYNNLRINFIFHIGWRKY